MSFFPLNTPLTLDTTTSDEEHVNLLPLPPMPSSYQGQQNFSNIPSLNMNYVNMFSNDTNITYSNIDEVFESEIIKKKEKNLIKLYSYKNKGKNIKKIII